MTRAQRAFSLVEILAAIAILALVLGAVLTLHRAILQVNERVDRATDSEQDEAGLDRLLRDAACAVQPDEENGCGFRLEHGDAAPDFGGAWMRLSFCATTPFDNPADPRWYGIENVAYRWSASDSALIRVSSPVLAGAGPGETNRVASRLTRLTVEVFDGATWRSSWTTGRLPRAARVIWGDDRRSFTAETFIAAGTTFKSARASEESE